jgi:seryl-tRNA synthetase
MPEPTTKATDPNTATDAGQNSAGADATGKVTDTSNQDAPKFTQADLDRIAAKTRSEEKQKAKEAKEKEDREREEARAKEQGEFEKLANDRKAKIEELEPKVTQLETELGSYRSKVAEMVAAELKALPDEVRDISPAQYGEDKSLTNPLDVLAWLPKGKALAAKLDATPAKPGAGIDPKPKGDNGKVDEKAKSEMARSYTRW